MKRPQFCTTRNCIPLVQFAIGYDPKSRSSAECFGVRKGGLKGKTKSFRNVPDDIFPHCVILGSHADHPGIYCFISNVNDHHLYLWKMLIFLRNASILKRTFRHAIMLISDDIIKIMHDEIHRRNRKRSRTKKNQVVDIGTKFIEYRCSGGEVLFREYNHDQPDGGYYKPDEDDKKLFGFHRRLGHKIFSRKAKRVKRSRAGDNRMWQSWPEREVK